MRSEYFSYWNGNENQWKLHNALLWIPNWMERAFTLVQLSSIRYIDQIRNALWACTSQAICPKGILNAFAFAFTIVYPNTCRNRAICPPPNECTRSHVLCQFPLFSIFIFQSHFVINKILFIVQNLRSQNSS